MNGTHTHTQGEKDYNIEDYHNFVVKLAMLEYHNRTWTWLDLLMQIKQDSQSALVAQAIKEKLRIRKGDEGAVAAAAAAADEYVLLIRLMV